MTAAPFSPLNGEWLWHFNLLQNFSRDFKLNASASLLGFSG
jgi:D-alanyl-D-alanine dipeptidase